MTLRQIHIAIQHLNKYDIICTRSLHDDFLKTLHELHEHDVRVVYTITLKACKTTRTLSKFPPRAKIAKLLADIQYINSHVCCGLYPSINGSSLGIVQLAVKSQWL